MRKVPVMIYLDIDLLEDLDELREEAGYRSRSALIRDLLAEALKRRGGGRWEELIA